MIKHKYDDMKATRPKINARSSTGLSSKNGCAFFSYMNARAQEKTSTRIISDRELTIPTSACKQFDARFKKKLPPFGKKDTEKPCEKRT